MNDKITVDTFRPFVGTAFTTETPHGKLSFTLDETLYNERYNTGPYHCFTLILSGPGNVFFPQGNYVFRQESLGEVPVFLIPIGKTETGFQYQVVYSVEK